MKSKKAKRPVVARKAEPVVGRSRFLVTVIGDIHPARAFDLCSAVAQQGKISGTGKTQQHCFATRFIDGTMVYVRLNKSGSEQFTVRAPTPNDQVEFQEGSKAE
jgi:archaeosine-15-forming tRNA-guanine transglycosylase